MGRGRCPGVCVGEGDDAAADMTVSSLCCWVAVRAGDEGCAVPDTELGPQQVLIFLPSFSFYSFLLDQVLLIFSALLSSAVY